MKNILIAVDIDDNLDKLIDKTAELINLKTAKLWLVHVAAPDPDFVGYEVGPQYIRDDLAHNLRKEHSWLAGYTKRLNTAGYHAEGLLIQGATVETLYSETKKLSIDLLIMGRHEHGWLYKLFNTPTTTGISELVKIPVLTIPN